MPRDDVRDVVFQVYHAGGAARWVSRDELGEPRVVAMPLRAAIQAGYVDSTKDQRGVPLLALTGTGLMLVEGGEEE
jgi:hypothetical protein